MKELLKIKKSEFTCAARFGMPENARREVVKDIRVLWSG